MPLGKGVTYTTTKSGVRLAMKGGQVVEAKNMKTGATHTPAEFAADKKKKAADKRMSDFMNQKMRSAI